MYNWSTNVKKLRKNREKHTIWRLESLINFGLNGEKIKRTDLVKNLPKLTIDPMKRRFLNFLLADEKDWQNFFINEAKKIKGSILI